MIDEMDSICNSSDSTVEVRTIIHSSCCCGHLRSLNLKMVLPLLSAVDVHCLSAATAAVMPAVVLADANYTQLTVATLVTAEPELEQEPDSDHD